MGLTGVSNSRSYGIIDVIGFFFLLNPSKAWREEWWYAGYLSYRHFATDIVLVEMGAQCVLITTSQESSLLLLRRRLLLLLKLQNSMH